MSTIAKLEPLPVEDWKDIVVNLLPRQGDWTDDAYLFLTDRTNRIIELKDGRLEVHQMPTDRHQSILQALFLAFHLFLDPRGGKVLFAPLRLRIRRKNFREPDLLLVKDAKDRRRRNRSWSGADLVAEVVSPDSRKRDLDDKPADYAAAKIPEYWIVDPKREIISVLRLTEGVYELAAEYGRGATAASEVLEGFTVSVDRVLDAE